MPYFITPSMMPRERNVIKEFLETYKFLPCLWDPSDKFYLNKDARSQAIDILVDKYKTIDSEATPELIKRRLENMRCAYKREYKKVLASRAEGSEYKPSLWYYKLLLFLDEKDEDSLAARTAYSSGEDDNTPVYTGLPKKVKKANTGAAVYIVNKKEPETEDIVPVGDFSMNAAYNEIAADNENEAEAFGKTVGLQLRQLDEMQKNIAEKLISEVIYYGRLNQLNIRASINLNEEFNL